MKLYLAASYGRKEEIKLISKELTQAGFEITNTWQREKSPPIKEGLGKVSPEYLRQHARNDLACIEAADALVLFTETKEPRRAGRHVEFGYALATGKKMYIIGPRNNIFHFLPVVHKLNSWEDLIEEIKNHRN